MSMNIIIKKSKINNVQANVYLYLENVKSLGVQLSVSHNFFIVTIFLGIERGL